MPATILLIEETREVSEPLGSYLSQAGFRIVSCKYGTEFYDLFLLENPALVLVGQSYSGPAITEICLYLRQNKAAGDIPVVMLTPQVTSEDRIHAFEAGVDDYLTLPLHPRELTLRLKAILRRSGRGPVGPSTLTLNDMVIDPKRRLVEIEDRSIKLTSIEFKLLYYLASRAGNVVTRDVLLKEVWGYPYTGYNRTVDTHIKRLRRRLGPHRSYIETLRGVGYRFRKEV